MSTTKQTVFREDTANRKIFVTRDFDAPLEKVWRAWTEKEFLDQWWAPKPWKAHTLSMDFRARGSWLYYMEGPGGERHWCTVKFQHVDPLKKYSGTDAFCDEKGNINPELPSMEWECSFTEKSGVTTVRVEITFASGEDLRKIVDMGFREGFSMAHGNLDEWLAT